MKAMEELGRRQDPERKKTITIEEARKRHAVAVLTREPADQKLDQEQLDAPLWDEV